MRSSHEDKTAETWERPAYTLTAEAAAHDRAARARRTPAEAAGDPTPDEQARVDEALAAWHLARGRETELGVLVSGLRVRINRGAQVVRERDGYGDYAERSLLDRPELARLRAELTAAEAELLEAHAAAHRAQRAFNGVNLAVGRACTLRRVMAQRESDIAAYIARKRAAGEKVDERKVRATWGRGEGPGIRVRGTGAYQGDAELIAGVHR